MAEHEVTEAMVSVPREELERIVKVLRYASHPHPSPHAEALEAYLDNARRAALAARTTDASAASWEGHITVTTNQDGHCVAVTRTDDEGRILNVIWEGPEPPTHPTGAGADAGHVVWSGIPSGWTKITLTMEDGRTKSGIVTPQYAEQTWNSLDENWSPNAHS